MPNVEPNARILIVRFSAIGDVVHALPVVNALRDRASPGVFGLGGRRPGRRHSALASGARRVDRRAARLAAIARDDIDGAAAIVGIAFRHTIDLQGLSKSAIAAWLCRRAAASWLRWPRRTRNQPLVQQLPCAAQRHARDRSQPRTAASFGHRAGSGALRSDRHAGRRLCRGWHRRFAGAGQSLRDHQSRRRLAIEAVAGRSTMRRWPDSSARPTRCARWSCGPARRNGPGPRRSSPAPGALPRLAPATSLGELTAIARRATLFVGSDRRHCTWRPPSTRPASRCSGPPRECATDRTARSTSSCKRMTRTAIPAATATTAASRWAASAWKTSLVPANKS